ncbi:MAG TPA: hypothetical protein VH560_09155 [Polyangia bacterium]|nr:hypothetical protein [Polyangia bacterium]
MNELPSENVRLTTESETLVREIEDRLLTYASPDARREWDALRARWPWSRQRRSSIEASPDDEPEVVIGKVRRFKAILGSLSERQSTGA